MAHIFGPVALQTGLLLGWIGEATLFQANQIRRIRNEMAHKLDMDSFAHPKVQPFLEKLPAMLMPVDGEPTAQ